MDTESFSESIFIQYFSVKLNSANTVFPFYGLNKILSAKIDWER